MQGVAMYEARHRTMKTDPQRRLAIDGFRLVEGGHNTFALVEFDVTGIRAALRAKRREGGGGSLFAFFVKAIAVTLARYPAFNAMVDRRRTTVFLGVDVNVPVEVPGAGANKSYIIRDADTKSLRAIHDEIEAARTRRGDAIGFVGSERAARLLAALPAWLVLPFFRLLLRDHERVRRLSGTVFVTSVAMSEGLTSYILPFIGGPKASSFALGGTTKKPAVLGGSVEIREFVSFTASFNHDLIDGAPAGRFIAELRRLIERGYRVLLE